VGDEVDHRHPPDADRTEEIDGVRFGLGEDRDEDIAAVDLLLAAALDVGDGPLQDAVEGDGLGRFGRPGRRQLGISARNTARAFP